MTTTTTEEDDSEEDELFDGWKTSQVVDYSKLCKPGHIIDMLELRRSCQVGAYQTNHWQYLYHRGYPIMMIIMYTLRLKDYTVMTNAAVPVEEEAAVVATNSHSHICHTRTHPSPPLPLHRWTTTITTTSVNRTVHWSGVSYWGTSPADGYMERCITEGSGLV